MPKDMPPLFFPLFSVSRRLRGSVVGVNGSKLNAGMDDVGIIVIRDAGASELTQRASPEQASSPDDRTSCLNGISTVSMTNNLGKLS